MSVRRVLEVCRVSPLPLTLSKRIHSIEPDLYSRTVRTNLDGSFYTTQAAARQMAAQTPPGGSIIGISSISALVGGGLQAHYTPTKAGILSLMNSCAVALGKHSIRCNALVSIFEVRLPWHGKRVELYVMHQGQHIDIFHCACYSLRTAILTLSLFNSYQARSRHR